MRSAVDLTTRARIRDAAITRFARDGFGVPLRVIAKDAGVSPALVIHHFGSKDGLRAACDEHVLEDSLQLKRGIVDNSDPTQLRRLLANVEVFDEPVAYLLQSLLAGGDVARSIIERTITTAEEYLEIGVASGVVKPSRDPAARARYLTYMSLGMLVTAFMSAGPRTESTPDDTAAVVDHYADVTRLLRELALPHLEVMTHGVIADEALLRAADEWAASAAPDPTTKKAP